MANSSVRHRTGFGQLPPFAVYDIRSFEWPLRLEQRTRLLGLRSASIVDIKPCTADVHTTRSDEDQHVLPSERL